MTLLVTLPVDGGIIFTADTGVSHSDNSMGGNAKKILPVSKHCVFLSTGTPSLSSAADGSGEVLFDVNDEMAKCLGNICKRGQRETEFRRHFRATRAEPDGLELSAMSDPECRYSWEREGELVIDLIQDTALVDEDVALEIQEILDSRTSNYRDPCESEFDSEIMYSRIYPGDNPWHAEWNALDVSFSVFCRRNYRTSCQYWRLNLTQNG